MIPEINKGSMSGIEIVGLLASVSQLVVYSIKITTSLGDICQRVQDAPLKLKQHSEQIQQLIGTAQLIQQNHLFLQNEYVHIHINATLEQAKSLSTVLEQVSKEYSSGLIRRYWKILAATKEKEILANFERLEKEKSALVLSISVAQTDLLGRGIRKLEMAGKVAPQYPAVMEEDKREDMRITQTDSLSMSSDHRNSKKVISKRLTEEEPWDAQHNESDNTQRHRPRPQGNPDKYMISGHVYENPTSNNSAFQLNANLLSADAQNHGPRHHFIQPKAQGNSHQLNGNVRDRELFKMYLVFCQKHQRIDEEKEMIDEEQETMDEEQETMDKQPTMSIAKPLQASRNHVTSPAKVRGTGEVKRQVHCAGSWYAEDP